MKTEQGESAKRSYNMSLIVFAVCLAAVFGASQRSSPTMLAVSVIAALCSGIWMARQKLKYYRHIRSSAYALQRLLKEDRKGNN